MATRHDVGVRVQGDVKGASVCAGVDVLGEAWSKSHANRDRHLLSAAAKPIPIGLIG